MSGPFPYTYVSCPCADTPVPDPARKRRSRESPQKSTPERTNASDQGAKEEKPLDTQDEEEEEQTFDPRSPRSNFSLYPPEQLLYCEDCHQIKCPRCITEEIVSWYCPNCLFETPSSMVRGDANRYVNGVLVLVHGPPLITPAQQMRSELLQLSHLHGSAICQYN